MKIRAFLMRFLVRLSVSGCLLAFSISAMALCLDSRQLSIEVELERASLVIEGLVTSTKDVSSPSDPEGIEATLYTVQVVQVLKGRPLRELTIRSDNTSSRFNMVIRERYLLFLTGPHEDALVDSCGNSGLMKDRKRQLAKVKRLLGNGSSDKRLLNGHGR